jgi:ACR3 family arsenite efflux pump ArsB
MIGLNIKEIFSFCDLKLQLYTLIVNFTLIPLIGFIFIELFFSNNVSLSLGFLLIALLPASGGMTITWTGLAKGNVNASVKMTVIGLLIGAVLAPFYMKFILDASVVFPLLKIFKQIILIVFIPLIIGYFTRVLLFKNYGHKKFNKTVKPKLPVLSNLGLILLIFIATALKANSILENPLIIIKIIIPLLIFYVLNYAVLTIIGKYFLSKEDCIAHIYGTALRSLGIALALVINTFENFGSHIALMIALAYIIQIQTASWYLKLVDKIL